MRTYGRVYADDGSYQWVKVETDANGSDDYVWVTTLIQVLKLSPGESPFYANYGIPGQNAVQQQVPPDYFVALTQTQFAPYFASLIIAKTADTNPTYNVAITLHNGVQLALQVAV